MRYHVCLRCGGSGRVERKPCEICSQQWTSKRMEQMTDVLDAVESTSEKPIMMDRKGLMIFAGFDLKESDEQLKNKPLGIWFEQFKVCKGEVIKD